MKLIRLHIENFGKFTNYDYTFTDGLNVLCEENGYGKTTIAAFIKAMFYSMPKYDGRTVVFTDRKHYLPFGGGKYGGSLTFEKDGAEYRIERTFGERSDTHDILNVYRNNAPYDGFGDDIGMALFGIDREAFERTAFIDGSAVKMGASDSISAKLNSIAGGVKSDETITIAIARLTDAAKQYKLDRGQGGKIYGITCRINALSREIYQTEQLSEALVQKYVSYNKLKGEVKALEERSSAARDAAVTGARWRAYDSLIAQEQAASRQYDAIIGAYPGGIPSAEEIAQLKKYSGCINKNQSAMDAKAFGGDKMRRLEQLKVTFAAGVPAESELDGADGKAVKCHVLEQQVAELKAVPADTRLGELCRKFEKGVPQSDILDGCDDKIGALHDIDARMKARMTAGQAPQTPQKQSKGGKLYIVLAVIAALLLVGGIALTFANTFAGLAAAGVGAVLLIIALVLYFNSKKGAAVPAANVDETLAELQYNKDKYTEELRTILSQYGYFTANVESNLEALKGDIKLYTELKEKAERTAEDIKNKTAELETLKAEIARLLAAYGLTNDSLQAGVRTLRSLADEYARLCNEERQAADDVQAAGAEIAEAYSNANKAILAKYGIEISGSLNEIIETVEQAAKDGARLKGEAEDRRREAEKYRQDNGLTFRPEEGADGADTEIIDGQIAGKNRQLASLAAEIAEMEDKTEKLGGLRDSLAAAQEELAAAQERYKLLVAARELLKTAQQNLKDKYVAPVKDKFTYYADKIEESLGEKVKMDGNFGVSFESGGTITSDSYLSAGQRCACALCFRLALMDNMYTGQQPFIIMDDPFVNLDEEHLNDALRLLRALAKDRQIIYFCCHPSRCA